MSRRRKKNPDAATTLAAVGGLVAGSFPGNAIGFAAKSPGAAMVVDGLAGGLAFWLARKSAGAARVGYYSASVGAGLNMLAWFILSRNMPGASNVVATVNGQAAPQALPPTPNAPAQWQAFNPQASAVPLVPGVRYRGAIDLPFGAGAFATRDRVAEKAREMGFSDENLFVATGNPDHLGWRDPFGKLEDGDLFVEATYVGAPRWLERNERIVSAWAFV